MQALAEQHRPTRASCPPAPAAVELDCLVVPGCRAKSTKPKEKETTSL